MLLKLNKKFPSFYEVNHPLIQHKLTLMRDVKTSKNEFNRLVKEVTVLLTYEATKNLSITTKIVKTPLEKYKSPVLAGIKPVIVPILRAGLGMVDGFLELMPSARVGHIGLFRDEKTLKPHFYYFKIPKSSKNRNFFVCDPMLATGGSAVEAVTRLKQAGVHKITFVCIIAAPEGVAKFCKEHPDVSIFAAHLDRKLNQHGYILPGLGDAGDRMFGTK
jgi:uracil phosphoribosyltransferase